MRCLYCGKQLALLKRLTGGGEFCSDAHKQSYQEEYNRLALSRLLQAQSKPGEIKTTAPKPPPPTEGLGQPLPPGAARRRALPASAPTPEPARAAVRTGRVIYAPAVEETVPVEETVQQVIEEPAPVEIAEIPESTFPETTFEEMQPEEMQPEVAEEAPPEVTVFSMEIPASSAIDDEAPYVEPWLEVVPVPATPLWQASGQSFDLPFGSLVSIAGPSAGELEIPAVAAETTPLDFAHATVSLNALANHTFASTSLSYTSTEADPLSTLPAAELVPLEICSATEGAGLRVLDLPAAPADFPAAQARRDVPFSATVTPARRFPAATPIHLDIRVTASGTSHQTSANGALRFPVRIAFQDSSLLNLYPSGIDFPAEDSDVVLIAPWADEMLTHSNGHHPVDEDALADSMTDSDNSSSPREVLEALSKLHQDLADQQAAELPAEPLAEPSGVDLELVGEPSTQNAIAAAPEEPSAATIDISAEPSEDRPVPRSAHDLFEIPWKTFAPPKPSLAVDSKALVNLPPEMPKLKSLPLRPKVAKAPQGFSPQSSTVQPVSTATPANAPAADPKAKTPAPPAAPARPEARTSQIPATSAKQPAAPVKSPPTVQTVKPGQTSKPAQTAKPAQPAKPTQTAKPPQPPVRGKTTGTGTQTTSKQPAEVQPGARDTKETAQPVPSPAAKEKEIDQAEKPTEETMPSFASIQTGKNGSFVGSLKGKLTIAILLIVIAGVVFYSMSNKSHVPAPAAVSTTDDAAGPSIMLGEGGWVQGWGGDPNGSNAGRQITIYRPSLKLSDYRIEFQGEIDSKSIGWVFRAMDPYNYYAMKLAIVTPGLSPKMALIRYAVIQGHEREMGRVPLDLAARNDTVFNVRMDVRGSKFTTYLQGQQVDVWTDEQIKSGGVGFLNERAERARIKSAAISYLNGGKN